MSFSAAELWLRPWAMAEASGRHRLAIRPGSTVVPHGHRHALWLFTKDNESLRPAQRADMLEPVAGFGVAGETRHLHICGLPLQRGAPIILGLSGESTQIVWHDAPQKPKRSQEPRTEAERIDHLLLLRSQAIWDRLNEVEYALADPANLWAKLRELWWDQVEDAEPGMDLIVRHANHLTRVLDIIERRPRRVLRRTHELVALDRVREVDRRAMTWLAKQPGESLVERAGNDQRVLAVARRENFNTLENRVVLSYSELADSVAREYVERNGTRHRTGRLLRVKDYGKKARRLGRTFKSMSVHAADPTVTPNFALQQNPHYHDVWQGWQELLRRERIVDELWVWQAPSWEEYCALALMVAVSTIPGSRLIASAPIAFSDEQRHGSWLVQDNPLGVYYLPAQKTVLEIQYRLGIRSDSQAQLGTQLWLRAGRTDAPADFQRYAPVWALWGTSETDWEEDLGEVARFLPRYRPAGVEAGLLLVPSTGNEASDNYVAGNATLMRLGTDGPALKDAIGHLAQFMSSLLSSVTAR